MPEPFEIREFDIDPATWTPIVVPFDCNNVSIRNTVAADLKIRTDLQRIDQDIIAPGVQEVIAAPISGAPFWRDAQYRPYRFMAGSIVVICKASQVQEASKCAS
jgi:hypothetical protein